MLDRDIAADAAFGSPADALKILGREKAFILVFCVSAMLTALALTYVASDKYETYTTIFYRPQEVSTIKLTETQSFGAPMPVPPFNVITSTLKDLLRSDAVLQPIVLELGLHEQLEPEPGPWYVELYRTAKGLAMDYSGKAWMIMKYGRVIEEDPMQGAVQKLRSNVMLFSKESFAFALVVRDKFPRRAALTVDALALRLVEMLREQERTPGQERIEQLGELIAAKQEAIDRLTSDLEEVLVSNDLASVSAETKYTLERWSELTLESIDLRGKIQEKQIELERISEKIALKEYSVGARSPGSDDYLQPDDYRKMASSSTFIEVELSGLEGRLALLLGDLAVLRNRLQTLPAIQGRFDQLTIELEGAKRDMVLLGDAYQEAKIRATGRLSSAKVLHAAPIPERPVAPIKIYHLGLAGLLSLAVAIGLVYVFAFFDVRLLFAHPDADPPEPRDSQPRIPLAPPPSPRRPQAHM